MKLFSRKNNKPEAKKNPFEKSVHGKETIRKLTKKEKRSLVHIIKTKIKKTNNQPKKAEEENKMEQKQEFERKCPILETNVFLSKDGRFVIHKTTITDIKPINYYKVALGGDK